MRHSFCHCLRYRQRMKKMFLIQLNLFKVVIFLCFRTDVWKIFAMYWWFRSVPSVMDISGLATIPETPTRPSTTAPPSQHVLKRPPLEGDYITVTDSSGNRVYLRQKEDAGTKVTHPLCDSSVKHYIFLYMPVYIYYLTRISHVVFHVSPVPLLCVSRWSIPE